MLQHVISGRDSASLGYSILLYCSILRIARLGLFVFALLFDVLRVVSENLLVELWNRIFLRVYRGTVRKELALTW